MRQGYTRSESKGSVVKELGEKWTEINRVRACREGEKREADRQTEKN